MSALIFLEFKFLLGLAILSLCQGCSYLILGVSSSMRQVTLVSADLLTRLPL
jgi:hypothetical protein